MPLTKKQLKTIILKECGCALAGLKAPKAMVIKIGSDLPAEKEITAGLFPGMKRTEEPVADLQRHYAGDETSETGMVLQDLTTLADKAAEVRGLAMNNDLQSTLTEDAQLQEKIAVANSMLDSVRSYLKHTGKK